MASSFPSRHAPGDDSDDHIVEHLLGDLRHTFAKHSWDYSDSRESAVAGAELRHRCRRNTKNGSIVGVDGILGTNHRPASALSGTYGPIYPVVKRRAEFDPAIQT